MHHLQRTEDRRALDFFLYLCVRDDLYVLLHHIGHLRREPIAGIHENSVVRSRSPMLNANKFYNWTVIVMETYWFVFWMHTFEPVFRRLKKKAHWHKIKLNKL